MNILPIDELNMFQTSLSARIDMGRQLDEEDIIDEMLDLFLLAYANGVEAANNDLGTDGKPSAEDAMAAVYASVAGEDWVDRVRKYMSSAPAESAGESSRAEGQKGAKTLAYDLSRIAETDMTRIYNQAVLDTVKANGAESTTYKRWVAIMDDRTREDHSYLDGMVIPYEAKFYVPSGDSAPAPGLFSDATENINCRCSIELIKG